MSANFKSISSGNQAKSAKSQNPNLGSIEEDFSALLCTEHNRIFEAYDMQRGTLVCPNCVLYGKSKGNTEFINVQEAFRKVRRDLDISAKEGLFNIEKSQSVLLDIRQIKLNLEERRSKQFEEAEQIFKQVIKLLKDRKKILLSQIDEHYQKELDRVQQEEEKWMKLQQLQTDLVELLKNDGNIGLLENCNKIRDGILQLKEKSEFKSVEVYNKLDNQFYYGKTSISFQQLIGGVDNFINPTEPIQLNFKS